MVQEVVIERDINLGQLLRAEGIIESGGRTKWFLQGVEVLINGVRKTRHGKKLEHQDHVDVPRLPEDVGPFLIIHQGEQ